MAQSKDALTWFEIPAADLPRATRFYEAVLGSKLKSEAMGPKQLSVFPYDEPGVGGCLIAGDCHTPAATGTVVYLAVRPALEEVLDRVKRAGGKIALPKTALPEGMGVFAHVIDSEGNRVGLHAAQ
jgi:predicted enzyme related to lactoylglutathione lyase